MIDWTAVTQDGKNFLSILLKNVIKDISFAPGISNFIYPASFPISNDSGLNKVIKEMYIGSSLDVSQIKTISVIKDFVSGSNHLTGLSIQW